MSIVDSIILGLVQGITEFLPISSTAHLILTRDYFGMGDQNGLAYDAILQLATSLAILLYFKKEFVEIIKQTFDFVKRKPGEYLYLKAIIIGTVPAVLFGLMLEDFVEINLRGPLPIAIFLVIGSLLFIYAEKNAKEHKNLSLKTALSVGLFQVLAIIPGMSRSGSTISGGLLSGLTRIEAARFSFLLSFPILFGAGIYKLIDLVKDGALGELGFSLLVGCIVAFTAGTISIHILLSFIKTHGLKSFIIYRFLLAAVILVLLV